ncbi:TonB-dependent receptor [Phenylobacterium sp.]|jgi:iron complex outermembrane receptor protein|uniref:TonB-dependent receptor n=1 Tax=Phenylobacterium sp. TaxID=1871053 RepID=UPI0037845DFA
MRRLRQAALGVCAAALAGPAAAQAPAGDLVRELVVTAQKRAQNLQDVPVVVAVLPARRLQDAGVRDIKDLQILAPGFNATSTASNAQTSFRIRGVGTVGDNPGMESSVGTVVDGVLRARSSVGHGDLGELERVEILKGPQGTLFGKNASAGVVNVITRAPEFAFGGRGEVSLGNYGAYGASASVTGPLAAETLAGRLFAAARSRDGYAQVHKGAGPGTQTDDSESSRIVRGQLLWRAAAGLEIRAIADYAARNEHCCVNFPTRIGPTAAWIDALAADAGVYRPADPGARITYANDDMDNRVRDGGVSLQGDWALAPSLDLTSITAWRKWKSTAGVDNDYSSADLWRRPADGRHFTAIEQLTQELRLAGRGERLDWIGGVFLHREILDVGVHTELGADYERYYGLVLSQGANPAFISTLTGLPVGASLPAGGGPRDRFDHKAQSWAAFGDATLKVTGALQATVGLRYTDENKDLTAHYRNALPAAGCTAALARGVPASALGVLCAAHLDPAFNDAVVKQSRGDRRWSGTVKVAYRVDPRLMTYVSYADGFKGGGFNLDRARVRTGVIGTNTSFPAETVRSWEVGVKANTADSALLANAAVFHQTFENFQLNTYDGVSFVVAPIPKVVSRGVDLDLAWRTPVDGLSLAGGATYAETQYGAFTPPPGVSARLPGSRLSYAPLWSATASGAYVRPLTARLTLRAAAAAKYSSAYNTGSNLDPAKVQPAFALLNGRIGVGAPDEGWAVELWGQNLTGEDYFQVIIDQSLQSGTLAGFLGAPRTYGVTIRTEF